MAAVGITLTASAQKTEMQMATLQHGDQTIVYYGPNALVEAYNAAPDTLGVITLSSGEFIVPNQISKSISIYGVGFEDDETTGVKRTYLNAAITLIPSDKIDDDGNTIKAGRRVNGVHLEGFHCLAININNNNNEPIRNLEIVKCNVPVITYRVNCYDNVIRQCRIINLFAESVANQKESKNLLISNCYFNGTIRNFPESSIIKIDHCLLHFAGYGNGYYYSNSIVYDGFNNSAKSYNNIFMEGASYTGVLSEGNWTGLKNAGVWAAEGEDGSYAEDKDFALKYPDRYIGTDGTEVGLHGGAYPWNKIPSIPRITECNIDTENAANGTIKVSIKAEAQTKE